MGILNPLSLDYSNSFGFGLHAHTLRATKNKNLTRKDMKNLLLEIENVGNYVQFMCVFNHVICDLVDESPLLVITISAFHKLYHDLYHDCLKGANHIDL